ncbi:MAG TPA: hypothetical protein VMF30_10285, partial [Pirellulales bacterium]|nr:hypothetical protein [Pirellulales bacterium]
MPTPTVSSGSRSATAAEELATHRRSAVAVCLFLLLAVAAVYGQTLRHKLLAYDDSTFVSANPHVTAGLTADGFRWAFTKGPYGEWYPLAMLSHMFDCQLFGLRAWGHHLTNLLLHAATSICLFLVWWRYSGELWPSALVAAVFAVHPLHVESVAWVSERKDVLSGLFFVLCLGAYLGYVRHGRTLGRYLLVALLFALGMLAKPMIVTAAPLLLLLDFWPLARLGSASDVPRGDVRLAQPGIARLLWEKLPLVALAAADCAITLQTHTSRGIPFGGSARLGNAAVACVDYLGQFFYPVDLAAFYPAPLAGPPPEKLWRAVAILIAVSVAAILCRRRCPYLLVGWFWYLGMLVPVLGVVTIGPAAMADRYMYLPSIGLSIAVVWSLARFVAARVAGDSRIGRWALATGAAALIATLMACAAGQTTRWRDDESLWTHALACT